MALPVPANTTCDIYRSEHSPPAAPDVAGVSCYLKSDWVGGQEQGEARPNVNLYTHIMLVDVSVDIRDAFAVAGVGTTLDSVYIPNKNGTQFLVIFVERVMKGTGADHKRVYLQRQPGNNVPWPTSNL